MITRKQVLKNYRISGQTFKIMIDKLPDHDQAFSPQAKRFLDFFKQSYFISSPLSKFKTDANKFYESIPEDDRSAFRNDLKHTSVLNYNDLSAYFKDEEVSKDFIYCLGYFRTLVLEKLYGNYYKSFRDPSPPIEAYMPQGHNELEIKPSLESYSLILE